MNKTIRCSSISDFVDCPRRMVTKQFNSVITDRIALPRETPHVIGAITGTAVHASAQKMHNYKREHGTVSNDFIDIGMSALEEGIAEAKGNIVFDDTTKSMNEAERVVKKMVSAYIPRAESIETEFTEKKIVAEIGGGWLLSGTVDYYGFGDLGDIKTGAVSRRHYHQVGGYGLLLLSKSYPVTTAHVDFMKRVSVKKIQPETEVVDYHLMTCMKAARYTISSIKQTMEGFLQDGDLEKIPANPASMLCSDKYCPACGTEICPYGN